MISSFFGSIPFLLSFVFVYAWAHTVIFQKNLVQTYSGARSIPKSEINDCIRRDFNKKYGVNLMEVSVERYDDEDHKYADRPLKFGGDRGMVNKTIGVVFSVTFSFSVVLIILMMCELMDVFDDAARLFWFKVIINSLIFLITCVQPFIMISLFFSEELVPLKASNTQRALAGVAYVGWFFVLHKCGDLSQTFTPDRSAYDTKSLIERKINEISIAGITTMAVLSGIGSFSTIYKLWPGVSIVALYKNDGVRERPKEISEVDLNNLIQSYNHTNTLISKRNDELNKLLVANSGTVYNQPNYSADNFLLHNKNNDHLGPPKNKLGGLIHKVQSFASLSSLSLDKEKLEETELKNEIRSLESLRQQIYNDLIKALHKFSNSRELYLNRNKAWVKAMDVFNIAFGIYCVYRIVNVFFIKFLVRLVSPAEPQPDPLVENYTDADITPEARDALTITIAKVILSVGNLSIQETQLVNQISFILSGSLFVCSFSTVLRTFQSLTKFFPSVTEMSAATKTWLKNLIIAELLGVYVIATAILLRTNLPANLSNQISRILSLTGSAAANPARTSALEIKFIDNWFDKVFAFSCASTFAVFMLRNIIDSDEDIYDEELMLESLSSLHSAAHKMA